VLDARLPARVAAVVSNNPAARGLEVAGKRGIATAVVDHRAFPDRAAFDAALTAEIDRHRPDLVVLAGFTRVLTPAFVEHYDGRIMNIHPSLLPAFTGLDTHRRALEAGVRIHGCTVHFVTPALDSGPIVVQAAVPVLAGDSEERLAARVLAQEHRIYPQAIRWYCEGRLRVGRDGAVTVDAARTQDGALTAPPLEAR
jgi:phosphoribosylglycinamide formyltransferase-1